MHGIFVGGRLRAPGLILAVTLLAITSAPAATAPGKSALDTMDRGSCFTASVESSLPERGMTPKGLIIRVNPDKPAYVLFDTDLLRYSVGWIGGPINFHGVEFDGEHRTWPSVVGDEFFGNRMTPGWAKAGTFEDPRERFASTDYTPQPESWQRRGYGPLPHDFARYKGLYRYGEQIILSYTVGGVAVLDSPGWEAGGPGLFTRTLNIDKSSADLVLQVLEHPAAANDISRPNIISTRLRRGNAKGSIALLGTLAMPATQKAQRPAIPADGLVSRWLFEKADEKRIPASEAKYSAGRAGGVVGSGQWGDVLHFKPGDHAIVEHAEDVDLSKDFSICGWIKTAVGGTVFSKTTGGKWVAGGKTLFIEHGVLALDVGWVGAVRGQKAVVDDKWHHVAVTYDSVSNLVRLFVDGAADGEGKLKITPDPKSSQIRFGLTSDDFPRDGGNRLDGALDEICLFRRALKAAEISTLVGDQHKTVEPIMAAVVGEAEGLTWELTEQSQLRLHVTAASTPAKVKIVIGRPAADGVAAFESAVKASPGPIDLEPLTHGGPPHWKEKLITKGDVGADTSAYVSDKLTEPAPPAWNTKLRFGGFDFFKDGKSAAICTWDGDVWIVEGIDASLAKLTWHRIAAGLFQPLGLKIVADAKGVEQIYVCCRDQITRLHDLNGDGEADFYESFNNDHQVTEHFHEFAMGLQTDAEGNFYYAKAARHALAAVVPQHGTVLKVDKDGKHTEIVSTGFRAANGFGLGPNGEMAATDQEGFWTPANRINLIKAGGFYGNMWSYQGGKRTPGEGYDPPMCWLPVDVDRSPAEDFWVTSDKWGPLAGRMLHTSYGTGNVFITMYETVDGVVQGGVVPMPGIHFPTGIMRGRFNPVDGQLYVCGLVGWSSNSSAPGGFYRVRCTGKPANLPVAIKVVKDGISLTFTDALDKESAQDPESYAVHQWQYRWTQSYGSKQYSISDPNKVGQDEVKVTGVMLSADAKTVVLNIPDIKPVMQMQIGLRLTTADGKPLRLVLHNTINKVPEK